MNMVKNLLTGIIKWPAGTAVDCDTLSLTNGTVKEQADEDWKVESGVVLVDWGNGNVIFVAAELLTAH
jgi:hypothetical protein